jgi:hypothetical protein
MGERREDSFTEGFPANGTLQLMTQNTLMNSDGPRSRIIPR